MELTPALQAALAELLGALIAPVSDVSVPLPERQRLIDLQTTANGLLDRERDPAFVAARRYSETGWSVQVVHNSPLRIMLSGPTDQRYVLSETDRSDVLAEPGLRRKAGDLPCDSPLLRWNVLLHLRDLTNEQHTEK
jgi:hypothetical protein